MLRNKKMKTNVVKALACVGLLISPFMIANAKEIRNVNVIVSNKIDEDVTKALKNLRKEHPRLIMTKEMFAERKELLKTDKNLQFYFNSIKKSADKILKKPVLIYKKRDGIRLLKVSREMLRRIYNLGIVWQMTGDEKYAQCARKNLIAVVDFPNWNPNHFLDVAEMTNAVGVGYDWFYDYLNNDDREKIRKRLIVLGLTPGPKFSVIRTNNWNIVCNGGLSIGALAVADTNPEYAQKILTRAVRNMPNCLAHFAPDGGWFEGPSYWGYTARYFAMSMAAMETALGTDFNLTKLEGLNKAAEFPVYTSDNRGHYFRFADSGSDSKRSDTGTIFWFATKYNKFSLAQNEDKFAHKYGANQYHFLWYNPKMNNISKKLDKDKLFKGDVPVAIFRNDKSQGNDIWIAAKAGTNGLPHGHLDVGSFELTMNDIRWVVDMGSDNYNLSGYWDGVVGGKRWSYPRLTAQSHNVPIINGKGQIENASSTVEKFVSKKNYGFWIINMSKLYAGNNTIKRAVAIFNCRREVMVKDEFKMAKTSEISWGFMTEAQVKINKNSVTLIDKVSKKELLVYFGSNADILKIKTSKIPYKAPAKSTDDYTRVEVIFTAEAHKNTFFNANFRNPVMDHLSFFDKSLGSFKSLDCWK